MAAAGRPAAKAFRVGRPSERKTPTPPSGSWVLSTVREYRSDLVEEEGVVGDVIEREVPKEVSTVFSFAQTGFPVAQRRTEVPDSLVARHTTQLQGVSETGTNFGVTGEPLGEMSASEIAEAQAEIRAKLRPDTIAFLKKRGSEKRRWSHRVPPLGVGRVRFSLEGAVVGWLSDDEWQRYPSDADRALQRDPLRQDEGSVAPIQGYTLSEALALVQSAVQAQRLAGLHVIQSALTTSLTTPDADQTSMDIPEGTQVTWDAVWNCAVCDLELLAVLRQLMVERGAMAVQKRALAILVELCRVPPAALAATESRSRLPLTGWPIPEALPLSRPSPTQPWARVDTPDTFSTKLKREMVMGLLEAVRGCLVGEDLILVLEFLLGCGMRGAELTVELIRSSQFMKAVKDLTQQRQKLPERCLFLQCFCCMMESHPDALTALIDDGWLEMISCEVGHWMRHPLTVESPNAELELLEVTLRCYRLCTALQRPLLSMEDLFAVYCTLLWSPQAPPCALGVVREVFLGFSVQLELDLSRGITGRSSSPSCVLSVKQTALGWLKRSLEGSDWSSAAAVVLFLANQKEWSQTQWTTEEASLLKRLLQDSASEQRLQPEPQTLMWLTSLLRVIDVSRSDADMFQAGKTCLSGLLENTRNCPLLESPLTQAADLDGVVQLQSLSHFANFSSALLHLVPSVLKESLPTRALIECGLRALTLMPPSYEAYALHCLTAICAPGVFQNVLSEVFSALEQRCEVTGEVLLDGLVATWCDLLPEGLHQTQAPITIPLHFSSCQIRTSAPSEGSHLPLPTDFLFYPLKAAPSWANSDLHLSQNLQELKRLWGHFVLLVYLELGSDREMDVTPGRRLKGWIQLLFLKPPGEPDFSTDPFLQHCFSFLVTHLLQSAPQESLFEGWALSDVEPILDAFVATGDGFLGAVVALLFMRAAPENLKTLVWQKLMENHLLHCIPDQDRWFGSSDLYTLDSQSDLREQLEAAWERGDLEKAKKFRSGAFQWVQQVLNASEQDSNRTSQY